MVLTTGERVPPPPSFCVVNDDLPADCNGPDEMVQESRHMLNELREHKLSACMADTDIVNYDVSWQKEGGKRDPPRISVP